jgi:streptogramin lyase
MKYSFQQWLAAGSAAVLLAACGAPVVGGNNDAGDAGNDGEILCDASANTRVCNGQCTDIFTNPNHCGACGNVCPSGQVCSMGTCTVVCPASQTLCNGVCTSLATDNANCGMCGNQCGPGQACAGGMCQLTCATGQTACGMPAACTNLQSDRANCGSCGNACAGGLVCDMGMCVPSCRASQTNCMGSCTSTETDPNHCGMCGSVCGPYANAVASCAASACIMTCNAGFNDCNNDRMDGCEVDTRSDVMNCGRCGNSCNFANGTGACTMGGCRLTACNMGFENADGIDANGCEVRTITVGGMMGLPLSGGTFNGVVEDPMAGGIVPSGMVTTTTNDYLWIPNVNESTVSKWDPVTGTELARYRVGLPAGECVGSCCHVNGCNMPSRVVVDGNGDAYIANRAFDFQGTVTKIAADRRDCVDRNGDGMIQTSTGPTNVLPFDRDECVLWTAAVGIRNSVLRAIAIDRGDASAPNGYVWVGSCNQSTTARAWKLDPRTGRILIDVAAPDAVTNCFYGAVGMADGRVWFANEHQGANNRLAPIDSATGVWGTRVMTRAPGGCTDTYGITADRNGRIWLSSPYCNYVVGFDPAANMGMGAFTQADIGARTGLGITVDAMGNVWTPQYPNGNNLFRFASSAFVAGGTIPRASITTIPTSRSFGQVTAIGADRAGNMWFTNSDVGSVLVKYNPMGAGTFTNFTGPNRVYTYSDFTGAVRRSSIPQGTYVREFDLTCPNPRLSQLLLDADAPAGTTLALTARSAATPAGLNMANDVPIATLPPNTSPYDLAAAFRAAGVTPSQHMRVTALLRASSGGANPVLRSMRVTWSCP